MSRDFFETESISRYDELLTDFKNLAINRFQWTNLPIGLTSEILESMLIEYGQVMCYKRTTGGLTILPCSGTNTINIYGQYDEFTVFGKNGHSEIVNTDDGIRIKNNPLASNNVTNLEIYAKRIDDIEMTQDVNTFQQNIPKIILTDESGKLTAKNLINELRKFKFAIFAKKSLTSQLSTSNVLDTTSPYLLDKLQDHKNNLINEVLTYLGINNINNDKKERMIVDEVNSNNDFIQINLDLMYDLRQKACEEINLKFGTNINVKKREVQINEQIHSDNKGDIGQ